MPGSNADAKRRLLMLAHDFPPAQTAGVFRPSKLAEHLSAFGWYPVVVTVDAGSYVAGSTAAGTEPEGVEIHRTRTLLPRRIAHGTSDALGARSRARSPRAFLGRLVRNRLLVPDAQVTWWPFAARTSVRLHRERPFDAIFATAPPFSSLLLGLELKRRLGCPFVADLRDPWAIDIEKTRPWEPPHRVAREREQEARVVRGADAVVVTADSLRQSLLETHAGLDPSRVAVVPNGYDPEAFEGLEPEASARVRLVYTGKLGGILYDPRALLDALDRWVTEDATVPERVELVVVGNVAGDVRIEGRACAPMVRVLGHVARERALRVQLGADALLLLATEPTVRRIPGKLFEYLYAGAPLIAMVPGDGDIARIVRETEAGTVVDPRDVDGTLAALRDAVAACESGRRMDVEARRAEPRVRSFARRAMAERLARLLDALVS